MGSPPSWPFMDFNNPLSSLLQEDQPPPQPFNVGSSPPPPASSSFSSPSHLLSSPASLGASSVKVSKRKSRAVSKPPIRVLSADRETFRDMVQKLTGIPTSPIPLHAGRLWNTASSNPSTVLFRPLPGRPGGYFPRELATNGTAGFSHQSMPTLDTSSAYLTRGFSNSSNLVFNEVGNASFRNEFYEPTSYGNEEAGAATAAEGTPFAELSVEGISDIESQLLLGSAKLEDLLQGRIDPWLTPHVEIAHSA
ncbi:hypothetical protein GOP47_0011979 [Adiantum capillus-veneris]|uniref:VQ domain-containing protein n=1 Tax=Adiantum capillus-veneris TaxID=13818 RepID=A0A9D4UU91_ADICA|nr:hypothetical protein GOP47_0011979 [Adiantum capillus-veneris]